eukprot:COSAG02_NODE_64108_length_261_cov_0.932099_1_plen_66_part_10
MVVEVEVRETEEAEHRAGMRLTGSVPTPTMGQLGPSCALLLGWPDMQWCPSGAYGGTVQNRARRRN